MTDPRRKIPAPRDARQRGRAIVYKGKGQVAVEQVEDPRIEAPTDVVVTSGTRRRAIRTRRRKIPRRFWTTWCA